MTYGDPCTVCRSMPCRCTSAARTSSDYMHVYLGPNTHERIADALERIAAALESSGLVTGRAQADAGKTGASSGADAPNTETGAGGG